MRQIRKNIFLGVLAVVYLAIVAAGTMLVHGRSLQQWVTDFVPPGQLREMLMYPLQHHHPLTFAKLLVLGDVLSNIFLFIPLGMIIFLVFDRFFLYSQRYVLCIASFTGLSFSVCIELVQYTIPKRIPSVSDVFANTAGALLGCSLFYIRRHWRKRMLAKKPKTAPLAGQEVISGPPQQ